MSSDFAIKRWCAAGLAAHETERREAAFDRYLQAGYPEWYTDSVPEDDDEIYFVSLVSRMWTNVDY
jgi:hypothetical protein